jgi:hypothetical protein
MNAKQARNFCLTLHPRYLAPLLHPQVAVHSASPRKAPARRILDTAGQRAWKWKHGAACFGEYDAQCGAGA